jgi:hypothetical protein
MKATASWSSNGIVIRSSSVPSSYSIGTRSRNRISWFARRACSSGVNGAAVNPSSARSARARSRRNAPTSALAAVVPSEAKTRSAVRRSAAPRWRSYSEARIGQYPAARVAFSASAASNPRFAA